MGVGRGDGTVRARGKKKRMYMPALPMPLATLCCVLNFIVPGLGTIIAGLSVCCCSRNEDMGCGEQCGSCTVSILIGLLQLILTVLLIGWVWSCVWGVMMIGMSTEYYHDNPVHGDAPAAYPVNPQQQQVAPGYPQYGSPGQPPMAAAPNQTYPYQPVSSAYPAGQQQPYQIPMQPYATPTQPYAPPTQPYAPPTQPYAPPTQPYAPPVQPYVPPGQQGAYPPPEQNPKMAPQAPPYSENRVEPSAPMEPPPPYSVD